MTRISSTLLCSFFIILISACSAHNSHTNVRMDNIPQPTTKASLNVKPDRGRDDALVILALSGGGSRAAYWSTNVMFKLQQVFDDSDLLAEVDAISSVSGGSLPAAYYAISTDEGDEPLYGRVWQEKKVKRLMKRNYIIRWFGNWFWPYNIIKFWFTAYDRSDIMAQTFADNLYDKKPFGKDLRIGHINSERPYLILNATNGTRGSFGLPFTFTEQDFSEIRSDINDYKLSRAVMGSAAFPAVFNYMTLKNFAASSKTESRYTHIFDGGSVDNLGLISVQRILDTLSNNGTTYDKLVVILVDAYNDGGGVNSKVADSRIFLDFIVDSNFIDATDSLLTANRDKMLRNFKKFFRELASSGKLDKGKAIFYHIQFSDLKDNKLYKKITHIKTNFKIKTEDVKVLDKAADILFTQDNRCLQEINALLVDNQAVTDPICSYTR